MKRILIFLLLLPSLISAQVIATRTNALNFRSERYVTNSPGNTIGNSRVSDYLQDSTAFESTVDSFRVRSVRSSLNHGAPTNILFSASDGLLRVGPVSGLSLTSGQITTALGFTPYDATNPSGYITGINSGMVTTALGFTPYNSTNPSSFITQAGARTAISITTTGTSGAASYNNSTGVLNIPIYANSGGTVTSVTAGTGLSGGTFTTTGTISMPNTGTAGTYSGVTTDAQGRVTGGTTRSFNSSPGRLLSTTGSDNTFTISATRDVSVNYTVNFAYALTLTTSNGVVSLDYSTNGGSSWITMASVSSAFTLAVTLSGNNDNNLSGTIPANALVRIFRSANSNVTVTLPTTKQQEVSL